jgi:predicted nucleic acid-binding protein
MIVLLDTDILIDVALNRDSHFNDSAAVLDLIESGFPKAFIAWHSIANFYYITGEQNKKKNSIEFIRDLLQFVNVAPTTTKDALSATTLSFNDFEDALQVAAAQSCKAQYIITRNIKHYKSSPVQAITPSAFLKL